MAAMAVLEGIAYSERTALLTRSMLSVAEEVD
jgi:hypothetical protein